jgi:hypothetical protein
MDDGKEEIKAKDFIELFSETLKEMGINSTREDHIGVDLTKKQLSEFMSILKRKILAQSWQLNISKTKYHHPLATGLFVI